jgi:hypothetical protein
MQLPAPSWPAARNSLAPAGPAAIRLCGYLGLNAHPRLTLAASRLVSSRAVMNRLVGELDHLPRMATGAINCPADDGSAIVALLTYPGGHRLTIRVGLTGCGVVTNGSMMRTTMGTGSSPPLIRTCEDALRWRTARQQLG